VGHPNPVKTLFLPRGASNLGKFHEKLAFGINIRLFATP
jgi:hypothetical protein